MLTMIMPELPLDDVPVGIAHYRDVLGALLGSTPATC
jgi:hypothetical protein